VASCAISSKSLACSGVSGCISSRLRRLHGFGGIARNQAVHNRLFEGLVQRSVEVRQKGSKTSPLA
jgi:hypothetical protein